MKDLDNHEKYLPGGVKDLKYTEKTSTIVLVGKLTPLMNFN